MFSAEEMLKLACSIKFTCKPLFINYLQAKNLDKHKIAACPIECCNRAQYLMTVCDLLQ